MFFGHCGVLLEHGIAMTGKGQGNSTTGAGVTSVRASWVQTGIISSSLGLFDGRKADYVYLLISSPKDGRACAVD